MNHTMLVSCVAVLAGAFSVLAAPPGTSAVVVSGGPLAEREAVHTLTATNSYALRDRIARHHPIVRCDRFHGFERTVFRFRGHEAWVVEPRKRLGTENRWTWTMQWAYAFVERTGVPDLLDRGWHHVTLDVFAERMSDDVLPLVRDFQTFLVSDLGLASKARLVGMSWGGFFSVRYATTYPEAVQSVFLDAPLLTFDGWKSMSWTGPWEKSVPACGWAKDPRMPVNMSERLAATGIPVLLLYGGKDEEVSPALNAEAFAARFRAAGGKLEVENFAERGHHPHGLKDTGRLVSFFLRESHLQTPL